jgi:leucyl aminopeptidase
VKIFVDSKAPSGEITTIRFVAQDQRAKLVPGVPDQEFSGKAGSLLHLRHENGLLVGLGERARLDAARIRKAAGTATMFLRKIGRTQIAVNIEDWPHFAGAVVEGISLANYRFEEFKAKRSAAIATVRIVVLGEDLPSAKRDVARAQTIGESTNLARQIANQPGNLLYPESLARHARRVATAHGLTCTVFDEAKLRKDGFGGLLAVGAGSVRGPRMMVLEHRGGGKSAPIALVGKAITFDSGGISIKPAANMEEMIFDKCGGMAVIGAMAAIAKLKLKRNVVGIIASAENMPSGNAYRPGDIVTTYDRKHVEIVNTDAEGRVVLADAIAYARKSLKAAAIVDLATLTGACGIALGEYAAGLWSNDDELKEAVMNASQAAGECLWPMPLFSEYEDQIRSDVALIKNTGGRLGGACTGAAFLKTFAEETPWAHLDIAYMAHRTKDQAHIARGATGFGVRTLVELVERWAR